MRRGFALLALCILSSPAWAADWVVDGSGAKSSLLTIDHAMAVASPGDRILVHPGSYPSFHFSRGVEVIGLGASPGDVVVARVDFHPNIPPFGYDTVLANLTVCGGGPGDDISTGGNELGAGTLGIHGVRMCGGVFLHGAGELYLMVSNSSIEPGPGEGFLGAAFDFGGGTADLVDTRIVAWGAASSLGIRAGIALRIGSGAEVRVSGSEILGGDGGTGSIQYQSGGAAIDQGFGALPALRLAGESTVAGGNAVGQGTGGAGVDVDGAIQLGSASVTGGRGAIRGPAYASSSPTALGYDPHLSLQPAMAFAQGAVFLHPGDMVQVRSDPSLPSPVLAYSARLDPPATQDLSPLAPGAMELLASGDVGLVAPKPTAEFGERPPRRARYFQAFFLDPSSGQTVTTNPVSLAFDP